MTKEIKAALKTVAVMLCLVALIVLGIIYPNVIGAFIVTSLILAGLSATSFMVYTVFLED